MIDRLKPTSLDGAMTLVVAANLSILS